MNLKNRIIFSIVISLIIGVILILLFYIYGMFISNFKLEPVFSFMSIGVPMLIGFASFPFVYLYFWMRYRWSTEHETIAIATSRFKTPEEIKDDFPSVILENLEISPKNISQEEK